MISTVCRVGVVRARQKEIITHHYSAYYCVGVGVGVGVGVVGGGT